MTTTIHKDFIIASAIGFSVGFLVFLPARAFTIYPTPLNVVLSVIGFALFAPLALGVFKGIARKVPIFYQIGKFAAAGTFNSFIDLGVLNGLMIWTGIVGGSSFALLKAISFLFGKTSGYFLNKFWTFESQTRITWKEYIRYGLFTAVGFSLNVGIAAGLVNFVSPPLSLNQAMWANIATVIAILVSTSWNFLSYRLFVFHHPSATVSNLPTVQE